MLASVGASLDSLDGAAEGAARSGAPGRSRFDGGDGDFLMALRQPKRKSIRQVRCECVAPQQGRPWVGWMGKLGVSGMPRAEILGQQQAFEAGKPCQADAT